MFPSSIARRWVRRQTLLWPRLKAIGNSWLGPELIVCYLVQRGSSGVCVCFVFFVVFFFCTRFSVMFFNAIGISIAEQLIVSVNHVFIHHSGYQNLFVCP